MILYLPSNRFQSAVIKVTLTTFRGEPCMRVLSARYQQNLNFIKLRLDETFSGNVDKS